MHTGNPCALCGGPLKVIGSCRKNGKSWKRDWRGRGLHKQCFKDVRWSWPDSRPYSAKAMRTVCSYLAANPASDARLMDAIVRSLDLGGRS